MCIRPISSLFHSKRMRYVEEEVEVLYRSRDDEEEAIFDPTERRGCHGDQPPTPENYSSHAHRRGDAGDEWERERIPFFQKPFSPKALAHKVRKMVAEN